MFRFQVNFYEKQQFYRDKITITMSRAQRHHSYFVFFSIDHNSLNNIMNQTFTIILILYIIELATII